MATTQTRRRSPGEIQDGKTLARVAAEMMEVLSAWFPSSSHFLIAAQSLRHGRLYPDGIPVSQEQAVDSSPAPDQSGGE